MTNDFRQNHASWRGVSCIALVKRPYAVRVTTRRTAE